MKSEDEENLVSQIRARALERFSMWTGGLHGIQHWERVHENAVYLADKTPDGDRLVGRLFAYLHDSCRESDAFDPEHGLRAAQFASQLREENVLILDNEAFENLRFACEFHEKGRVSDHPTVGLCWDSDRLDLGRVAIVPNPDLLSTQEAKKPEVIDWAYQKSQSAE